MALAGSQSGKPWPVSIRMARKSCTPVESKAKEIERKETMLRGRVFWRQGSMDHQPLTLSPPPFPPSQCARSQRWERANTYRPRNALKVVPVGLPAGRQERTKRRRRLTKRGEDNRVTTDINDKRNPSDNCQAFQGTQTQQPPLQCKGTSLSLPRSL